MGVKQSIVSGDVLFEITDIFGLSIRTTNAYWQKITKEKHRELHVDITNVIAALQKPDEVYKSVQDDFINIYYKQMNENFLVVVVKFVNECGFVITCYQTSKTKRKGEQLWP